MNPEIWSATDNFLSFWTIFSLFTTLKNLKNQNFEKNEKKRWEISSFCKNVPKIMTICSSVPGIRCMTGCNSYFSFWVIFCTTAKKSKLKKKKKEKMPGDIILKMCTKNNDHMMYSS